MDLVPDIKAINLTEEQKQEISIKTTVLFMDSMNMNPEHIEILSNKLNGYEVLVDFIRRARITSYNVCYTKLLRNKHHKGKELINELKNGKRNNFV